MGSKQRIPNEPAVTVVLGLSVAILLFNVGGSILTEKVKTAEGTFAFNPATAVVAQEPIKFGISFLGFSRNLSSPEGAKYSLDGKKLLKFAVPALLYAIGNIISYEIMKYITASQFQVFNNGKIVITAFVFRSFLGRKLKMYQWFCVLMLGMGMCVTALPGPGDVVAETSEADNSGFAFGIVLMLIQCFGSSFAGVYNEFLLKSGDDDTNFQNMQLYFWGVVMCLTKFFYDGNSPTLGSFFLGWSPLVCLVVLVNALYGQIIALTFKYGDNMVKVNANSVASLVSAAVTWYFFGVPVTMGFWFGSVIVCCAVRTYYCDARELVLHDSEYVGGNGVCGKNAAINPAV